MGAWSKESFGNDTACDWAYELERTSDLSLVQDTIQQVIDTGDEYLEAPDAEEAIAAAEVIARLKGNFGLRDSYSKATDTWVETHPQLPSAALSSLAAQALDRILREPSELLSLWSDSDEFEAWKRSVLDLKNRVHPLT